MVLHGSLSFHFSSRLFIGMDWQVYTLLILDETLLQRRCPKVVIRTCHSVVYALFRYTISPGRHNRWAVRKKTVQHVCSAMNESFCAVVFASWLSLIDVDLASVERTVFFSSSRSTSTRCSSLDDATISSKWIDRSVHCRTHEFLSGKRSQSLWKGDLFFIVLSQWVDLSHRSQCPVFRSSASSTEHQWRLDSLNQTRMVRNACPCSVHELSAILQRCDSSIL